MEYMLSEALPIYSGGLGNVAGDQLKAASDLGVPVVGVGLLYQRGYFRQIIDNDGAQQALYPYNDPGQLPIIPLRQENGEWLRLEITLPGYSVWLRAWQVNVGRVKLYLLDSNDAANFPAHRGITSELYGGGPELRLKQEILLGIGGWRLLTAIGIKPDVCHLNEGHAAFAVLERARCFMQDNGQDFGSSLSATQAGNLFTTHTAVAAGFDRFPPQLISQYLKGYAENGLRISIGDFLSLGRRDNSNESEFFNMAYLAMHGSGSANGVSRLHGIVSRHLFQPLYPNWPEVEVPIGHVTNGVHMPTWDSSAADDLWTKHCGKDRWLGLSDHLSADIHRISDADLWEFRMASRKKLVEYARNRLALHYAVAGAPSEVIDASRAMFDPNALTIGFARRFATYKRPNLLLHDPHRLKRILSNLEHPVQLIIAGKAHPADTSGQLLLQKWVQFIRQPEIRHHAIFLSDYDMHLTERLVQGVDVWLNTPMRPWEACGTSGMKVLVNGGLNLSELDGWWAEAYSPELGWSLGDIQEHGSDPNWDAHEAEQLYQRLENEIIPEFYARDDKGIPVKWVSHIRESMSQLTPRFSASRSVCDYTNSHYIPAAISYQYRAGNRGSPGNDILGWKAALDLHWDSMHFGERTVTTRDDMHFFAVPVYWGGIDPGDVTVELYADGINGGPPLRQEFQRGQNLPGEAVGHMHSAQVPASRSADQFTVRIIPHRNNVEIPMEAQHILWQR